jgi:hypothetical protein
MDANPTKGRDPTVNEEKGTVKIDSNDNFPISNLDAQY